MRGALSAVPKRVKARIGVLFVAALAAVTAAAAPDEKFVRQTLPVCPEMKVTLQPFEHKMPSGMSASVVTVDSSRNACDGQYLAVTTSGGNLYVGAPWFLSEESGATIEEKVKNFAWNRMQSNVTAVIDREHPREPGLFPITIHQTVEAGKFPLEGFVDREGKIILLGKLYSTSGDPAAVRVKALQPFIANAPARGAEKATVTVVEFSDFQCPSCKYASHVGESIVAKYGDSVRYVRYDVPLVQSHPWALGAAMAGRAIHRQKPELFWEFKKAVYEKQDTLSAFTFYDFARAWAEDHDLDVGRYDSDMGSQEIRTELLNGLGAAFSNDVRATPTYMVNGVFVDPGNEAKALDEYVAGLIKK